MNQWEFEEMLTKAGVVQRVARRFRCDPVEIEQQLRLSFLKRPRAFLNAHCTVAYLTTAARNVALALKRQSERFNRLHRILDAGTLAEAADARSPSTGIESAEVRQRVREVVEKLPGLYRDIVIACCLNGVGLPEFSARHGLCIECAKSRLRRAKESLATNPSLKGLLD